MFFLVLLVSFCLICSIVLGSGFWGQIIIEFHHQETAARISQKNIFKDQTTL